ncbi:hypothetical protein [Actinoplanes sp. NPDC051851]|uniref:hypothetical protein n=1 Tax=Actinoplanes sp. NPDC051851 TaxID=3154753 RepID=UPI003422BC62
MRKTIAIAALTVAAVLAGLAPAGPAAASDTVVLQTLRIDEFTQTAGQSSWAGSAQNRLLGASWEFDGGEFTFRVPGGRDDLYPMTGTYTVEDDVAEFTASSSSSSANGSASADISGEIDLDTGRTAFDWNASSGSAAVVYGTGYATASTSGYTGEVTLG